ncbi:2-amino-4-hydroxy-6-hydroxymethyldihydropteridine diphosphokinase [Parasphingorhabdus sp. JC815]|uniref:2-amino-4-hydroxy-6- hydroxymethyldihydropteridine diphosphokinase n=1 Tax=Parasphingorhabdus sp. JC815 TaxID=3232140 RepID=UPI00345979EC
MPDTRFLIALGSNQRHVRHGSPRQVISAALSALEHANLSIIKYSAILSSRPVGPSSRSYANAAAIIQTALDPDELLILFKTIESDFGKRRGQPWSQRVLDLDIILWSEGSYSSDKPQLTIPHIMMRERLFVLRPAAEIAPKWRDPLSGLTITQLASQLAANSTSRTY